MKALALDFENSSTHKPAFYQSNDPAMNVLILTISNHTGTPVTFDSDTSKLRIDFANLLSDSEVHAIVIQDAEWHGTPVNSHHGVALELSCHHPIQLADKTILSFSLSIPSVGAQSKHDSGNLTILYTGLIGIEDDETVLRFFVLKPPSGKPSLPLDMDWMSNMPPIVFVSPNENALLTNSLGIFLSNKSNDRLVYETGTACQPRFLISFSTIPRPDSHTPIPNPGRNALTYDDLAKDIWIRVVGDEMNMWSLSPSYGSYNEALVWELRPLSPGILGAGESVELFIDNIRTVLPPFTTALHIQYLDIPGYDDGVITLHMEKSKPSPGILSFYADDANIDIGESVSLTWSTFAVASLVLTYSVDEQTIVKRSSNGDITLQGSGYKVTPHATTTYTLTAFAESGDSVQRQLTVMVNHLNVSMVIVPLSITQGGTAKMSWKVSGSDQDTCVLDPGGILLPLSGVDYPLLVNETTPFSITAFNRKNSPPATSVQTIVSVLPVTIHSFTATPNTPVEAGSPVTLSWNTEYASSIALEPADDLDPPVSTHPLQPIDRRTVRRQNNTTYTLTATGLNGPVHTEVPVTVHSVEITSFTASRTVAHRAEKVILSWTTNRATSAWLFGGALERIQSESLAKGSIYIKPSRDMTYTLSCLGPNGPAEAHVAIEISTAQILSFTVTPQKVKPDGTVTLKWETKKCDDIWIFKMEYGQSPFSYLNQTPNGSIYGIGSDQPPFPYISKNPNGSIVDHPLKDTTYYLVCPDPYDGTYVFEKVSVRMIN
jgi:hypothetical protein